MEDPYQDRSLPDDSVPGSSRASRLEDSENDLGSHLLKSKDYYAILNVSKKASEEDIREAYDQMTRVFHPDKHSGSKMKETAETKLQVLNRALEVLCNPQLRAVYDKYGEEGLDSKQETRDEYARLAREKQQLELENLVRSRNDITIHLDASRVLEQYQPPSYLKTPKHKGQTISIFDTLGRTEIMQLYMKNSFQTQFGPQTRVTLGGNMTSSSGTGSANIVGTIQHTFSDKMSLELGASLTNPGSSLVKGTYNLDQQTYVSGTAYAGDFQGPTPLAVSFGRRLTRGATGYMTYRTGEWILGSWRLLPEDRQHFSSMTLGIKSVDPKEIYYMELQAGVTRSCLLADRTWTLDDSTRVRVGARMSDMSGLSVSLGGDRRITQHTRLGLAIEIALSGGLSFNIKAMRLGQSVTVPILLSTEFNPRFAFWTVVAPVCAIAALDFGYIKPKKRRERAEKLSEFRKLHAEFIANQRKEAEEAINLLRDSTARKVKQEQSKDGLIVIEAIYGNISAGLVADVTVAVQALVNNSQLVLPGGHSKNHILGFYDPCLGEKKLLKIRYEFQKKIHEVTVADTDHVMIPIQSHIIET
ncbi:hypothetical protein BGZ76_010017 [Entomortierella beljakovae]|nr:hypothetical protein BGZ76_010017 [Entomortierella beljakovae]